MVASRDLVANWHAACGYQVTGARILGQEHRSTAKQCVGGSDFRLWLSADEAMGAFGIGNLYQASKGTSHVVKGEAPAAMCLYANRR